MIGGHRKRTVSRNMRIAFISYEAPPDMIVGGIGTYIGQAARTMAARGHEVEVFAASRKTSDPLTDHGYLTHRLQCGPTFAERLLWPAAAGGAFAARHAENPFDVLEGPEFLAEAGVARKLVPAIPLVVKLHMSMTLIRRINGPIMTPWRRIKLAVKGALQPVLQLKRWKQFDYAALELPHLLVADEISAPCREIADITSEMWGLDRSQMVEVPYPFVPTPQLLAIPVETTVNCVGFVGRLEQRKGVMDLAKAIPLIRQRFPRTRFVFAGATEASPVSGLSMQEYLTRQLASHAAQITFLGHTPHEKMDGVFRNMDICVLPSLWENFPNACLEAMAAGRGIVGSSAGGMAQQLDAGQAGLLVPPGQPGEIAAAVCQLLENPELRMDLGRKARARVLAEYSTERIGCLTEESYARAIQWRRAGGRRWRVA